VLLQRDTPAVRAFAADWHARWLTSRTRCGDHRDQPALNAALHATSARFQALDDRWNAQFTVNGRVARGAVVWHYYASRSKHPTTGFERLVQQTLAGAVAVDTAAVRTLLELPDPWLLDGAVDRHVADRIARHGEPRRFDKCWLRRQPVRAAFAWLLRL
jgi:hypothetical protein